MADNSADKSKPFRFERLRGPEMGIYPSEALPEPFMEEHDEEILNATESTWTNSFSPWLGPRDFQGRPVLLDPRELHVATPSERQDLLGRLSPLPEELALERDLALEPLPHALSQSLGSPQYGRSYNTQDDGAISTTDELSGSPPRTSSPHSKFLEVSPSARLSEDQHVLPSHDQASRTLDAPILEPEDISNEPAHNEKDLDLAMPATHSSIDSPRPASSDTLTQSSFSLLLDYDDSPPSSPPAVLPSPPDCVDCVEESSNGPPGPPMYQEIMQPRPSPPLIQASLLEGLVRSPSPTGHDHLLEPSPARLFSSSPPRSSTPDMIFTSSPPRESSDDFDDFDDLPKSPPPVSIEIVTPSSPTPLSSSPVHAPIEVDNRQTIPESVRSQPQDATATPTNIQFDLPPSSPPPASMSPDFFEVQNDTGPAESSTPAWDSDMLSFPSSPPKMDTRPSSPGWQYSPEMQAKSQRSLESSPKATAANNTLEQVTDNKTSSSYKAPNPRRQTVSSIKREHKKLVAPFRSPVVDNVGSGKPRPVQKVAPRALTAEIDDFSSRTARASPARVFDQNKPVVATKKNCTPKAAGKFKSPLSPGASAASRKHAAVKFTPTIQALERRLQVLKRAVKIKQDGDEEKLEELVGKWRNAGREVAWEVWGLVKDKAETEASSGKWGGDDRKRGLGASWGWEERDGKRAKTEHWGYDEQPHASNDDGPQDEEPPRSSSPVCVEEEHEEEKKEDTLGTMLRQLGIDPTTLGWDDEEGDFVDVGMV